MSISKQLVQKPTTTPSTWLGVLGGGQLGRMFAQAAQAMGYRVAVLDPQADCPAGEVADHQIVAEYTDPKGLEEMAALCAAVTTEFENVSADSLDWLAKQIFTAPGAKGVSIAQYRLAEKQFFVDSNAKSHVMPAPYVAITTAADIDKVTDAVLPGILKTARLGYDGKGQFRVSTQEEVRAAFAKVNGVECVLEKMLPLDFEVSVLVARGADGQAVVYPIAENAHRDGILFTTTVPGPHVSATVAQQAQQAALALIAELDYVGVLCIEFFVLKDGTLVVNEMAPRPHNSGHYTIDACVTSQFAQQARAMAHMPLGDVRQHSPAVMLNILGDVWFDAQDQIREPAWDEVVAIPGANLHLYGKKEARHARKMGHITFVAATIEEAQANCAKACRILGIAV